MNNGPIKRLGEVCVKIGSGATPRGGRDSYKVSGIPLIRSQNVLDFAFSEDGLAFIDGKQAKQLDNVIVQPNDVLINITGDSIARVCKAPVEYLPARVNQHVSIIRADPEKADPNYLLYYLQYQKPRLLSLGSSGGTRNALTKQMLEDLQIPLPHLSTQHAIGCALASLDAKIASNKRINHHLEQMAQAIYKEWFIDNDEVGKWEKRKLGDVCEFSYGKGLKEDDRQPGPIGVYGSNGLIGWHGELLAKGPGIVVGRKGNPGTVTWVAMDFYPIDTAFYVTKKKNDTSLYWLFYTLKSLDLPNLSADSAVPGLNRNIAYLSYVLYPPEELMHEFDELVKPTFETIHANIVESRTLTALRDTLLPRLMSGELSMADVDAK
ncbi:MAG: restriction endonuclease subunit S [Anaerolineaceae bacterium]|nr:restriction endonuclease subunit S [Anaerolineaceae bacterium]